MPRSLAPSAQSPHCRLRGHGFAALVVLLFATYGSTGAATAQPSAAVAAVAVGSVEADLFNLTNSSRASAGLAGLQNDQAAASVAREWSATMSSQNTLRHNPNLAAQVGSRVTTSWQRIGENVGVGYSASSLHDAFMNSSGHRANILGDFNRVGVGAVVEPSGRMWVTLIFIKGPAIALQGASPIGQLDFLSAGPAGIDVQGWAIDLDTTAALEVHVLVNGAFAGWGYASQYRPDVGSAFPGYGNQHGFSFTVPPVSGSSTVCVYAINVGTGINTILGCRSVSIAANPSGNLEGLSVGVGTATVGGWAFDPQTTSPIEVHVLVDGRFAGWGYASGSRPDVGAAYPGYGSSRGFNISFPLDGGLHDVCVYAINVGIGVNNRMSCQSVDVQARPIGNLDGVVPVGGSLVVDGWGLDPQTSSPIEIHVLVDGAFVGWGYASYDRSDVGAAYPAFGPRRGFSFTTVTVPGTHQVCIYGINVGAGVNTVLGCRQISM